MSTENTLGALVDGPSSGSGTRPRNYTEQMTFLVTAETYQQVGVLVARLNDVRPSGTPIYVRSDAARMMLEYGFAGAMRHGVATAARLGKTS